MVVGDILSPLGLAANSPLEGILTKMKGVECAVHHGSGFVQGNF